MVTSLTCDRVYLSSEILEQMRTVFITSNPRYEKPLHQHGECSYVTFKTVVIMVMTFMVVVVVVVVVTKKMETTVIMMMMTTMMMVMMMVMETTTTTTTTTTMMMMMTTKIAVTFCETVSSIIHKARQNQCPINIKAVIFCQNKIFCLICTRN